MFGLNVKKKERKLNLRRIQTLMHSASRTIQLGVCGGGGGGRGPELIQIYYYV